MNTDTKTLELELKEIGMAEKEAKVFLASLELGSSAVQEIAKKADINRATTYVIIEKLMKKGLMSSVEKGKKTFFQTEDPKRLLKLLEEQEEGLKRKEEEFKKYLPELETLFNISEEKPKVRFFEGKEGVVAIQKDILRSKFDSIAEFVPLDESYEIFPPDPQDYRHQIRKVAKKMIYSSKSNRIVPKEDFAESRSVPSEKFSFNSEVVIYGDKTAIVSLDKKLIGVIIESKGIADSLKSIFNLAWEAAEKYQK